MISNNTVNENVESIKYAVQKGQAFHASLVLKLLDVIDNFENRIEELENYIARNQNDGK